MESEITFLINSTKKNIEHGTLDFLIDSFYQHSGEYPLSADQILVVIGNSDAEEAVFERRERYSILRVFHNSIDFTAHIAVVENKVLLEANQFRIPKYWFYLHDTSSVGPQFFSLLKRGFQESDFSTKPLTYSASMNIGIYSYEYLMKNRYNLLLLRSVDHPNEEQVVRLKKAGVHLEDILFRSDFGKNRKEHIHFSSLKKNSFTPTSSEARLVLGEPRVIYRNSEVKRLVEYFPDLDFYKYKANWYLRKKDESYELAP